MVKMPNFGKMLFYDWTGGNEALFQSINGIQGGEIYDSLMVHISRISDYKNFPYYFVLLLFCACIDFGRRKFKKRGGANHTPVAWFGVLCVFLCAFAVDGAAVKVIKSTFAYPRPYVALEQNQVTLLDHRENDHADDHHSFPSGHVSFVTMMLSAVWPVLSKRKRWIGSACVLLVAWSRIAVGMHFPADVFYAALLSIILTFLTRWFMYKQLLRFRLKC